MRIAYIIPSLEDTSGWGRWSNDFLNSIPTENITPVIWAPPEAKEYYKHMGYSWEAYFTLPKLFDYFQSRDGLIKFSTSLSNLVKSFKIGGKIDLVHSLDAHPWGFYGYLLAKQMSAPHVITTHGRYGYIAYNRILDRWIYNLVLRNMDKMIAVSEMLKKSVLATSENCITDNKIIVLQNPVDADSFSKCRTCSNAKEKKPIIISVTRFVPVKDLETAVLAFKIVKAQIPNAQYYIVGPGNGENNYYYKYIKQLIVNENIEGIRIVGRVSKDKLVNYYQNAVMLLHTAKQLPDDYESSGLILLEAGLFSLPVVASRSGGIPEVVEHNKTGILAEEGDINEHAAAMLKLLQNKELAMSFGQNNKLRALERNWNSYVEAQQNIYNECIYKTEHSDVQK